MPVTYHIDAENRVVFSRLFGCVTGREIFEFRRALERDPEFVPSFAHLMDLGDVEELAMSNTGINMIDRTKPFSRQSRRAVVAPGSAVYERVCVGGEACQNCLFHSMEAAYEWLGISEPVEV